MFSCVKNWIELCIRKMVVLLTNFLPVKVIRDERGVPFLYRYHLFSFGNDGAGVCIHHFCKSDPERGYHDHPWKSAASFILAGGYEERILNLEDRKTFQTFKRDRWTLNYLVGENQFHRVMIPEGKDAWTIFFFRKRSKTWGMISLEGDYKPMSTSISDADGGWWNHVGNGYALLNRVKLPGQVVATVDVIVVAEDHVLLIKRGKEPFKGCWAFPGGRVEGTKDKDLVSAAQRELKEETNLDVPLKFVTTVGNTTRDPRGFCITSVFLGQFKSIPETVKAGDDAVDFNWFPLNDLPDMAFDHQEILKTCGGLEYV